ncbi:MAG: thioredoxin family protein [Candidatus Thorarchaeota archaeon]|jgi:thiol-disulfide isomerase/thioredoxin
MPKLDEVTMDCQSCCEYIDDMSPMYKSRWLDTFTGYKLNSKAVEKLKVYTKDYEIIVLFADWCGDARKAVPALARLEEEVDMKIRALGGMTKPGFGSDKFWAVPPSPIEVELFDIRSSPTIIIFRKDTGKEVGRILTKPKMTPTIEEEIVKVIEDAAA